MDELLEQFLIEGREQVQQASDDLLALERDPTDMARVDSAFRAVHTLKGSVALFDFGPMGAVLHAAEDLLGSVRAKRHSLDDMVIGALLDCISACDAWMASIARTGALPENADADSLRLTEALQERLRDENNPSPTTDDQWIAALLDRERLTLAQSSRPLRAVSFIPNHDCYFRDDPVARVRAVPQLQALHVSTHRPPSTENYDPYVCILAFVVLSAASDAEIRSVFAGADGQLAIVSVDPAKSAQHALTGESVAGSRTLRVDTHRIEALVDVLGEMIVAKNVLAHLSSQAASIDPRLARALTANQAQIDRLVSEMHRSLMGLRMVPLARTFRRFPRLVRDLASKLGKRIDFHLRGEDVEADRAIVDGLYEPLLHMLRNAVDHGMEDATAREQAGKPVSGTITLEASRQGDKINITVADDGPGLDAARIRQAAKAARVVSSVAIDDLQDEAALDLIFAPGLSTAREVTDISGRGVGLDAVRTAVDALGGRISISSTPGQGTTARLILPQAVIVTPVLVISIGDERFGVPIEVVAETARFSTDRLAPIRSGEAFIMRNETIPLMRLATLLGGSSPMPRASSEVKVLIASVGNERIGIEVDDFGDRIDVLLRPMTGILARVPGILGSALLGDGRVLMVLNIPELIG
jgi:two-component system, chemotaxis family, sensor kinase CheA